MWIELSNERSEPGPEDTLIAIFVHVKITKKSAILSAPTTQYIVIPSYLMPGYKIICNNEVQRKGSTVGAGIY